MKKKRVFIPLRQFVLVLMAMFFSTTIVAAEVYTFGIVPQFEARKLTRIWGPIIDEIERRTGFEFEIVGSPRIPEFEAAFSEGAYDFAYMNPYHAIIASEKQGYSPFIRDGARQLYGVLLVREDSTFKNVKDLQGKEIAFPAPNALGASLMIRSDLVNAHKIDFTPNYVSTHGSAYLNVILEQVAAAGGVMGTFRSQPIEIAEQLRVLYETSRVPPHPITVHPRVPEEVRKSVQDAFLELGKSGYGGELLAEIPMLEAVPAQLEDYRQLKEMGLDEFIVTQ